MSDRRRARGCPCRALRAVLAWAALIAPGTAQALECANGLYVGAAALQGQAGAAATDDLLQRARGAGVRHLFLYGQDAETPGPAVTAFIAAARAALGGVRVVAMMGRRVCAPGTVARCVDLADRGAQDRIVAQAVSLWQKGYDGVQLDLEPVANGDPALPALLQRVRAVRPTGKSLSITGYSLMLEDPLRQQLQPSPKEPGPLLTWDRAYYQRILAHVDQVMVMNYDTALRDAGQYRAFTAWQVAQLRSIQPRDVDLQFGLPSSVAGRKGFFDRSAENLTSGMEGVRLGLAGSARCPSGFGVTIFTAQGMSAPLWTTFSGNFASP